MTAATRFPSGQLIQWQIFQVYPDETGARHKSHLVRAGAGGGKQKPDRARLETRHYRPDLQTTGSARRRIRGKEFCQFLCHRQHKIQLVLEIDGKRRKPLLTPNSVLVDNAGAIGV
jgi:hypothetical protein